MPCNTRRAVHILEEIKPPQHQIISIIWQAFNQINFSIPITSWITPAHLSLTETPVVKLWQPTPDSKLELLAGFRSYNLALAVDLQKIATLEYTALSEVEAMDIALNDILQHLLCWSCGKSANSQIYYFCKNVRKSLPEPYKKQLPKPVELRDWLNISSYIGRKQPHMPSKITLLRQNISATQEDIEQAPDHDDQD